MEDKTVLGSLSGATPLKAFVIGPIGDEHAEPGSPRRRDYERALEVLEKVIRPACQANEVDAIRSDDITRGGQITEQIYRMIRDSPLVIADVTGLNPNVMYELGLRHSTGKLTIPIGERGSLPFDIAGVRTILFLPTAAGLVEARRRLNAAIAIALTEGADPVTATRVWFENRVDGGERLNLTEAPSDQAQPRSELPLVDDDESPRISSPDEVDAVDVVDTGPGYLERIAEMEDSLPALTQGLMLSASIITGISETLEGATAELRGASTAREKLALSTLLAAKLDTYSTRLGIASAEVTADVDRVENGLKTLRSMWHESVEDEIERADLKEAIANLSEAALTSLPGARGFHDGVVDIGRSSRALRNVTQKVAQSVDVLIKATERVGRLTQLVSDP